MAADCSERTVLPPDGAAVLRWAVVLAAAVVYLWLHAVASLTFPIPWPDEASFMWPAIALERTGSLFAPQLNPERDVLWMPPGYMVVSGLLFKVFGFSLSFARALSCAYLLASFVLLVRLTGRLRLAPMWPPLCAAFLLSQHWVFAGNVARMEALVVLMACGGFLLLAQRRLTSGALLLGLTPLVHPNGLFLAAGAVGLVAIEALRRRFSLRVTPTVLGGLLFFAVCWLAYLFYVAGHWTDFRHDMQFQAEFKGYAGGFVDLVMARMSRPAHLVALALTLAGLVSAYSRDERLLPLAWLGVGSGIASTLTWGFNYTVYDSLFFLGSMVLGGEVLFSLTETRLPTGAKRWAAVVALALALLGGRLAGYVESPVGFPERMGLYGLRLGSEVPYITDGERDQIRRLLDSLADGPPPTTIRFYPGGDGLLFADLDSERLRFVLPVFHTMNADVHIVHRSRHIPELLDYFTDVQLSEQGFTNTDLKRFTPLAERDGTERWLWRRSAP